MIILFYLLFAVAALGWTFISIFAVLLSLAIIVLFIYGGWKFFEKCGVEGWKSIIPLYNTYVLLVEICGLHWGFALIVILNSVAVKSSLLAEIIHLCSIVCYGCAFYNFALRADRKNPVTAILGAFIPNAMMLIFGLTKGLVYNPYVEVDEFSFLAPYIKK